MTETSTELALSTYRPRSGRTDELLRLIEDELETLRRRGHVTARRAPVALTDDGDVLVVLEWSSRHAVDDAHADPEVLEIWERKAHLADYIAPASLAGVRVPFARWAVIADV